MSYSVMETELFIAGMVNSRDYVVVTRDGVVVAGPFATAAEAVKAREALLKQSSN
jgi:hypothetical protein